MSGGRLEKQKIRRQKKRKITKVENDRRDERQKLTILDRFMVVKKWFLDTRFKYEIGYAELNSVIPGLDENDGVIIWKGWDGVSELDVYYLNLKRIAKILEHFIELCDKSKKETVLVWLWCCKHTGFQKDVALIIAKNIWRNWAPPGIENVLQTRDCNGIASFFRQEFTSKNSRFMRLGVRFKELHPIGILKFSVQFRFIFTPSEDEPFIINPLEEEVKRMFEHRDVTSIVAEMFRDLTNITFIVQLGPTKEEVA